MRKNSCGTQRSRERSERRGAVSERARLAFVRGADVFTLFQALSQLADGFFLVIRTYYSLYLPKCFPLLQKYAVKL